MASSSVVKNSLSQRAIFLCAWFPLCCIPKPSLMGSIFKPHFNISLGMQLVNLSLKSFSGFILLFGCFYSFLPALPGLEVGQERGGSLGSSLPVWYCVLDPLPVHWRSRV